MINHIKITADKRTAIITYTDGTKRTVYQSDGEVLRLLNDVLNPIRTVCLGYQNAVYDEVLDDTQVLAA